MLSWQTCEAEYLKIWENMCFFRIFGFKRPELKIKAIFLTDTFGLTFHQAVTVGQIVFVTPVIHIFFKSFFIIQTGRRFQNLFFFKCPDIKIFFVVDDDPYVRKNAADGLKSSLYGALIGTVHDVLIVDRGRKKYQSVVFYAQRRQRLYPYRIRNCVYSLDPYYLLTSVLPDPLNVDHEQIISYRAKVFNNRRHIENILFLG